MNRLRHVLEQQKKALRPSAKPPRVVHEFLAHLRKRLPGVEVMAGGSFAKGTSLRGGHDIDVFARFPKGTPDNVMGEQLRKALPTATVLHGSRDYVQLKRDGMLFEVVPVQHITAPEELLNVTDMSPLHVAHVQRALTNAQRDDVRLAKQFCKAAGIYGAESHVRGFSGYVLELLIAHYGGFERLLRTAAKWPPQLVIDPAKQYSSARSALLRLNEAKTISPLVLVDPLDAQRNAAAAVSEASYQRFRERAASFLAAPHSEFFDTVHTPQRIRRTWPGKHVLFVQAPTPKGRQDIVGCTVLAAHDATLRLLAEQGFTILHAEWRFGERTSIAWYVLEKIVLPNEREQRGPPANLAEAVAAFRYAHPQAYQRDGRWYTAVRREYPTALAALRKTWGVLRGRVRVLHESRARSSTKPKRTRAKHQARTRSTRKGKKQLRVKKKPSHVKKKVRRAIKQKKRPQRKARKKVAWVKKARVKPRIRTKPLVRRTKKKRRF